MSETIKVFELAKELGLKALDLLEKLKPLDLKLKNHMADLSADQVERIKNYVSPPAAEAPAAKKTVVRKKSSAAAASAGAIAGSRSTIVVKAKTSAPTSNESDSASADDVPEAVNAAPTPVTEKVAPHIEPVVSQATPVAVVPQSVAPTPAVLTPTVPPPTSPSASASAPKPQMVSTVIPGRRMGSSIIVRREAAPAVIAPPKAEDMILVPEVAPVVHEEQIAKSESASVEVAQSQEVSAPVVADAPPPRRGPRYSIIRVVSAQGDAPKRNITVEEAPANKNKGSSAPKTFTDPALARSGSALIEEEEARKKKSALASRTRSDEELMNFKSTDYLRRERVYQPKKKRISIGGRGASSKISTVQAGAHKRVVEFDTRLSVENLAEQLAIKVRDVSRKLEGLGIEMPDDCEGMHDWYLDFDTVQLVVTEFNYDAKDVSFDESELLENAVEDDDDTSLSTRPPVVTIMGHVDHGKTSLLDTIRKARVASGEAGGITQHIGAYQIKVADAVKNLQALAAETVGAKKDKKKEEKVSAKAVPAKATKKGKDKSATAAAAPHVDIISFLDTPGHAAFSSMRARGAKVTDIVVLVVSAIDGVMPQTKEAVEHARAAGVPLIVAVNKCDLPEANPDRIKQQLGDLSIVPEEWGGDTIFVNLSAKTGEGVDKLLEMLQIQAEMLNLKARAEGPGEGSIVEAKLDKGRGPLATVLVKSGVLKVGDYIVAGTQGGKVRALIDDKGVQVKEAGPSKPVEILGLSGVPEAGDQVNVVADERDSKALIEHRMTLKKLESAHAKAFSAEDLFARMASGELKELPMILKGDVKGSVEAIQSALMKLPQDKVRLKVLSTSVGGINESDVLLASASKAIIVGFNVRADNNAQGEAERRGVVIKAYSIIYELLDEITKAMEGLLSPTLKESIVGRLEVRNVFANSKVGQVAGCYVLKGKVLRSNQVRIIRDNRVIYTGKISGLKRFKDDAREVAEGFECGVSIENYNDIKVGDNIEAFSVESTASKLNDGPSAQA